VQRHINEHHHAGEYDGLSRLPSFASVAAGQSELSSGFSSA
jgi:hypothetical protein